MGYGGMFLLGFLLFTVFESSDSWREFFARTGLLFMIISLASYVDLQWLPARFS